MLDNKEGRRLEPSPGEIILPLDSSDAAVAELALRLGFRDLRLTGLTVRSETAAAAAEDFFRRIRADGELDELGRLAYTCVEGLKARGATLALAESCTGGLLARMVTEVPGASAVFLEGVVVYSDGAKMRRLGVREETINAHGAVSEACAREMAEGLIGEAGATLAMAITGIAGPTGGSDEKPVGTVFFALAHPNGIMVERARFPGERPFIRVQAAFWALNMIRRYM